MAEWDDKLSQFGLVQKDRSLAQMTTYRIGGKAHYTIYPNDSLAVRELINYLPQTGLPWKTIGKGSDLLCSDQDYDGVIIRLDKTLLNSYFEGNSVVAQAGVSIIALAMDTMKRGLSGLEFASGIPGTVGGSVFMNAGAYKSSMADILSEVLVLRNGEMIWMKKEELALGYRSSIFQQHPEWMILAARMNLVPEDPEKIRSVIEDRRQRRMNSQPLEYPTCGSVFRNPPGGFAWKYIDALGFRGMKVGGAQVSEKHSNFIINTGNATARDVDELIRRINQAMMDTYGFALRTEVERFNWPTGE